MFAAVPVTPREFCDCSGIRTRAARNTFSSDQHGQHQYNAFSRAYVVGFFLNIFSSCSQESVRSPETQREFGALTYRLWLIHVTNVKQTDGRPSSVKIGIKY